MEPAFVKSSQAILAPKKSPLLKEFEKFILAEDYPCLMAKTAFSNQQIDFHAYEKMGELATTQTMLTDLDQYIRRVNTGNNIFYSFIAAFPNLTFENETIFEKIFWHQLQLLHDLDVVAWDATVSSNPEDANFSFSIRGQAFYLIGMHPNSSRIARQAPCPAIIFNLHSQFEQLRNMGAYQRVRNKIRKRDIALQGSMNPMMENFGVASEVKQYSGKAAGTAWKCPFHSHASKENNL